MATFTKAAASDYLRSLKELVAQNPAAANVAVDTVGCTHLYLAAANGSLDVVRFLTVEA